MLAAGTNGCDLDRLDTRWDDPERVEWGDPRTEI
jgi:hypothetical protein